jgi:hypothetical protein
MLIGARRARELLVRDGVSTWSAARVLESGLAGEPIRTGSAVLYDEARVVELAGRPSVGWPDIDDLCPAGLFVSRRDFPATAPRADQLSALCMGWSAVNMFAWVGMTLRIPHLGPVGFVATIGGLVVLGADIVETRSFSELVLAPPGPWFESAAGHWMPSGPGRPWLLTLGAPMSPGVFSPSGS